MSDGDKAKLRDHLQQEWNALPPGEQQRLEERLAERREARSGGYDGGQYQGPPPGYGRSVRTLRRRTAGNMDLLRAKANMAHRRAGQVLRTSAGVASIRDHRTIRVPEKTNRNEAAAAGNSLSGRDAFGPNALVSP